ncbi:hypothetical protein ACQR16_34310 [Bradyrhizobium oligotrophicum]|uniref:hypothetical protein n=1 Tax=Bradyrhizobium oligotrophicum TaxID=44255 RepID=UPI003EBE1884
MLSQAKATPAAACPARRGLPSSMLLHASALLLTLSVGACQPRMLALTSADPADPAASIAPVRASAVTAPYTSLRPAAPAAWGSRREPGAARAEPSR